MNQTPTKAGRELPQAGTDALPLWVIVMLLLFVALRVLDLSHLGGLKKGGGRLSQISGSVDEQTMQATVTANSSAKLAYLLAYRTPGPFVVPDPVNLRQALTAAEEMQAGSGNSPGAARRVLVLRFLLHRPLMATGKNGLSPAAAFAPSALQSLSPAERAQYADEGRLWAAVADGPHLTPAQTDAYAAQLRHVPNIRWWLSPALSALYGSQGNEAAAQRYARQARTQALATLVPMLFLGLLWFVLGLGGMVLLLLLISQRRAAAGETRAAESVWPALRETVPASERRLRAGDLMGVFALYLLMRDLLGWLLGGFGIPHWFHVPGLLSPWRGMISALPAGSHVAAVVILEFFGYLLGAAVPIGLLLILARRRRASVGDELGWNLHRFGANLLYGVGGYAIALPLVMLAGIMGKYIPAPAPSNPAIPLLAGASSVWVQVLLVSLATVAAPLTEELLFRGVFYNAAKLKVGIWPAIVLTGLVFGFAHPVGIAGMLPLMVLGGVFAWMAETRQSLVPSMLGHFLQNGMATAMLLLALGG